MFLSTNDNIAPWFKVYCRAHELARDYVCNPMWFDGLIRSNDNLKPKKPIRVWPDSPLVQCATTLEIGCSHISSRPFIPFLLKK